MATRKTNLKPKKLTVKQILEAFDAAELQGQMRFGFIEGEAVSAPEMKLARAPRRRQKRKTQKRRAGAANTGPK